MSIISYGWDRYFSEKWKECCTDSMVPARVVGDYGQMLRVAGNFGETLVPRPPGNPSGHMLQVAVGDWIAMDLPQGPSAPPGTLGIPAGPLDPPGSSPTPTPRGTRVSLVLPRKTKFSRTAAGIEVKEQVVAANVDTIFLMQSLNRDFNMRRLERYLIAAWESGAQPVVVLTKADVCSNVTEKKTLARRTAPGVPLHTLSCLTGEGMEEIHRYFSPGKTVAFLGSSGVGKSTLANRLLGEEVLRTKEVRADDDRGRHATTRRELLLLPGGGLILDTPGMRTLLLWEAQEGMEAFYGDVEDLVRSCRFKDCRHQGEPGCAVRDALESGSLEQGRWEHWVKLQKELRYIQAKKEGKKRLEEKKWGRHLAKLQKEHSKGGYKR